MASPHYLRAETLYAQGKYKLAIASFKDALKEEPENIAALSMLAMSLSLDGQNKEALREIKEAQRRAPDSTEITFTAGLIYYNAKKLKEGEKLIKQSLAKEPENAHAHLILSYIAELRKNWKLMREEASKALEINPNYEDALIALAAAQRHLGQKKEAQQSLESALLLNPNKAKTHAHLGHLMLHNGNPKGAREHLREALRLDPNSSEALEGFVESLRSRNFFYYWFITCIWAISRGPARFLVWVRHPAVIGLILFFWYIVWLVREVTTLALRFDKEIRHYLPPELIKRNNRNLALLFAITATPYIAMYISDVNTNGFIKEFREAVQTHQVKKAETLEERSYRNAMDKLELGSLRVLKREELLLIYQYELARNPQNLERLAFSAVWLGLCEEKGAYPNKDLIAQASSLAKQAGNQKLISFCQKATEYANYQNLPGKEKNKVEWVNFPEWPAGDDSSKKPAGQEPEQKPEQQQQQQPEQAPEQEQK